MQVISIIKSIFLTVALTGFAAAAAAAGQMTNNQNLDAADSNISAVNSKCGIIPVLFDQLSTNWTGKRLCLVWRCANLQCQMSCRNE